MDFSNPARPKPPRTPSLRDTHANCFLRPASHDAYINYHESTATPQVLRPPGPTRNEVEKHDPSLAAKFGPITDVTVRESGIVYTINHKNCQSAADGYKQAIATLFYTGHRHVEPGGDFRDSFISQAALFDFISTWDKFIIPWRRWDSSHRCLEESEEARVIELSLIMPEILNLDDLRRHEDIAAFESKWGIEVSFQPHDVFHRYKRLAVFDMDSTLIQQEVIDEIARYVGVEEKVSAITSRAMNGEIDFTESLKLRCSLLNGVPATVWETLQPIITFTPGARELCRALKALGFKLAVLSGGFMPLATYVKNELRLDYAVANNLVVSSDGTHLTGELTGRIVDATRKAELLECIARREGIDLRQTIAIGDGANDLLMLKKAGLGIAFNAKPKVQAEAPIRLNSPTLRDVLYILGLPKGEQEDLLALPDPQEMARESLMELTLERS